MIWLDSPNLSDHPSVPYIPLHLSLDSLESLYHTIMASSSREAPVNQHISGLTVSDVAKVLAGTANNTTNKIHNGWYTIPSIEKTSRLNLLQ